jgi:hypothetical protein
MLGAVELVWQGRTALASTARRTDLGGGYGSTPVR